MTKKDRVGEQNTAKNGLMMTIIAYRNVRDIDIQFEDGIIVYHKNYSAFKQGNIKHPNINITLNQCKPIISRIGETKKMNCGLIAKIIAYRNAKDIDVEFKDGTVLYNRTYEEFKYGKLSPNVETQIKLRTSTRINNMKKLHIGETKINNQNLKMTIIEYRNSLDIDVEFEDGTIVKHRRYAVFKKGCIANPNVPINKQKKRIDNQRLTRLGKVTINTQGLKMKIIEYRSENDIDVQFEDGTIVQHKRYSHFCEGKIKNPNLYRHTNCINAYNKWINYTKYNTNNGLKMSIIDYKSTNLITIQYETGYTVNTRISQFRKGCLKHPFPYTIETVIMEKPAYVFNGIGNFYCTCTKCGHKDILTIDEIKEHKCNIERNFNG